MIKTKNKSVEGHSDIISGAFSLTLSTVIVKVLGLIYKIPLSNILGDEGMGYFNSAYTVYAFFYLICTAGVPKAVMILISEAKAEGDRLSEYNIVRKASRAFFVLGVTVTALFMICAPYLSELIGNRYAGYTMLAIAPSIIFISLAGVIRGYLSANMKLLEIAVSQIIEGVGKLVVGLLFALWATKKSYSLPMISAFTILGVTVGSIVGTVYLVFNAKIGLFEEKTRQKRGAENNKRVLNKILSISVPITASAAVMSVTNVIDLVLTMRRLESVGYSAELAGALYGNYTTLAVPMFNLAISLVTPISIAFLPTFAHAVTLKKEHLLLDSAKSSLQLTALLSSPIMVGLSVYSKEILSVLYKNADHTVGASLLCLLVPAIFFSSTLLTVNSVLECSGLPSAPVVSMSAGAVVKVISSFFLLSNENYGISGAPISTVLSYAIALFVSLVIMKRHLGITMPLVSASLLPILNSIAAVFLSRPLYNILSLRVTPICSLGVAVLISALLYVVFSYASGGISIKKLQKMSILTKNA